MKPHVRAQGVQFYLQKACPWYGLLCILILQLVPRLKAGPLDTWRNPWSPWRTSFLILCAFYLVNTWLWTVIILQPANGYESWSRDKLRRPTLVGCATALYLTLVVCAIPLLTMPIPAPPEVTESVWRTMTTLGVATFIFQTCMGSWMAMMLYNDIGAELDD